MPMPTITTPIACIYVIVNDATRKLWIGQTGDYCYRMLNTINQLNANVHRNEALQSDWQTHGISGFSFKVIQLEADPERRLDSEHYWIRRAQSCGRDLYNKNLDRDDGRDWA